MRTHWVQIIFYVNFLSCLQCKQSSLNHYFVLEPATKKVNPRGTWNDSNINRITSDFFGMTMGLDDSEMSAAVSEGMK